MIERNVENIIAREIIEREEIETEAQTLIDAVNRRLDEDEGSGIKKIGEKESIQNIKSARMRAKIKQELRENEGEKEEKKPANSVDKEINKLEKDRESSHEINLLFDRFAKYFLRHPNINGKDLVTFLSRKERARTVIELSERTDDRLKEVDWGESLIKLTKRLLGIESIDTPKGTTIDIETFFEEK